MFQLIIKYCNHFTQISAEINEDLSAETIDKFFAKFAKQLKSIDLDGFVNKSNEMLIKTIVKLCTNLTHISYQNKSHLFVGTDDSFKIFHVLCQTNDVLFKKLTKCELYLRNEDMPSVEMFFSLY